MVAELHTEYMVQMRRTDRFEWHEYGYHGNDLSKAEESFNSLVAATSQAGRQFRIVTRSVTPWTHLQD